MREFKLVVAEPCSALRQHWEKLVAKLPLEVRDSNIRGLLQSLDIDCVVMPSWIHERLGGVPVLGSSAVLSNREGIAGTGRWIATTPTFPAMAEDATTPHSALWPSDAREQGFVTFGRVLQAIYTHNQESVCNFINTIGVDPDFLGFNADYEGEVLGVAEAFVAFRELNRLERQ